jgi:hypothetical protein
VVKEAMLRNQDYIVAGNTGFNVLFVSAQARVEMPRQAPPPPPKSTEMFRGVAEPPPAPPAVAPKPEERSPFAAKWDAKPAVIAPPKPVVKEEPATAPTEPVNLLDFLRGQKEPLYAVLDAARSPQIITLLREFGYQPAIPDTPSGTQPQILKRPPTPEVLLAQNVAAGFSPAQSGSGAVQSDSSSAQSDSSPAPGGGPQGSDAAGAGLKPAATSASSAAPSEPPADATLCQSLYDGYSALEFENFAPYLLRLPPNSELLEILVAEGWGKSWGIYLTCSKPFAEVRKHHYFRFYDPRVLRAFLPTCNPAETQSILGPVRWFFAEHEFGEVAVAYEAGKAGVAASRIALLKPAESLAPVP